MRRMISVERTVSEESNEWLDHLNSKLQPYGFEELLDECFTTGSCVFLPVELMYLGAICIAYLAIKTIGRKQNSA